MLFYWLILGLRKFVWLFKIPSPQDIARITPRSPCPVCGNSEGNRIRCVWQLQDGPPTKDPQLQMKNTRVLAQRSCALCGARWFENPVVKVDPTRVLPSVARDELEKAADRSAVLAQSQ